MTTKNKEHWYYAGFYIRHTENNVTHSIPGNSAKTSLTLKIVDKKEAEELCKTINNSQPYFTYTVTEYKYKYNGD